MASCVLLLDRTVFPIRTILNEKYNISKKLSARTIFKPGQIFRKHLIRTDITSGAIGSAVKYM